MVSKYAILLVSPVLLGTILNPGVLCGPGLWVHYTAVGSIEPSRQPSSRDEDLLPVPRFSGACDDTAGRELPLLVVRIIRLGRQDFVRISPSCTPCAGRTTVVSVCPLFPGWSKN